MSEGGRGKHQRHDNLLPPFPSFLSVRHLHAHYPRTRELSYTNVPGTGSTARGGGGRRFARRGRGDTGGGGLAWWRVGARAPGRCASPVGGGLVCVCVCLSARTCALFWNKARWDGVYVQLQQVSARVCVRALARARWRRMRATIGCWLWRERRTSSEVEACLLLPDCLFVGVCVDV